MRPAAGMSVHLKAIHAASASMGAARERDAREARQATSEEFASALREARRPGSPTTPRLDRTGERNGRSLTGADDAPPAERGAAPPSPGKSHATVGNEVRSRGSLSEDPHTFGMYVPPDFYHGKSYSPVFDRRDENGNWVPTPRFPGQKIYSPWRGSLPDDWDPNARVEHDPLNWNQSWHYWKRNENGDWVRRETAYGGIPLDDSGKPMFTPDPVRFPEYYAVGPDPNESEES